jgi:hypothetical protein
VKRYRIVAVLATVLGLAPAHRAAAQEGELVGTALTVGYVALGGSAVFRLLEPAVPLTIGAEVRVSRANAGPLRGTLGALDSAGVTVRSAEGDVRVATGEVRGIRIYRGRESKWAQGFAIGFASGGVLGAATGFLSGDDDPGFLSFTAPEKAVIVGIAGAVAGSTLGAVIGLTIRGDHWRRVKRVNAAPVLERGAGTLHVGLRLRR